MPSKKDEINFYENIYSLAFGRESRYFYQNDSVVILNFLKENFWGESLQYKIRLLSKLLYFDSYTHPTIKTELRDKSNNLLEYMIKTQE